MAGRYYYIHDRLGSIRVVVDEDGDVINSYTYDAFGRDLPSECNEMIYNPFKFTGQWYDSETGQYYLRARMYDPVLMRFTAYDPVLGKQEIPLTLHPYLYCTNDSINAIDLSGEFAWPIFGALSAGTAVYSASIYAIATGIEYDYDELINMGFRMQNYIAPAMYFGAITGPLLPVAPGIITNFTLAVWDTLTTTVIYTVGYAYVGGEALVKAVAYWAIAYPESTIYGVINVIDMIAQIGGPPGSLPTTPLGALTWLYVNYDNYMRQK
ncbi:MAG: RHS repeat-associated core domain-containing protein [Sedimentisphaerales bacterium]|nr:RHS repeat-associated core domain-containing protein [Sedimentisphaerales bacterium]